MVRAAKMCNTSEMRPLTTLWVQIQSACIFAALVILYSICVDLIYMQKETKPTKNFTLT